ncbi:hypothetical protein E1B28_007195 [Marasmius oreades]|uniref:F-box domain-containing protein n=1 Tax=Marasmius oreades TaxID=181124 RepID=A0A9P7S166_9AGAR|nr:uncharacterized protein E1B28_007195 [Marasmius oreades]KAG7093521.1 hypothetical protein E1B28_007195 [Marasmius oreades]
MLAPIATNLVNSPSNIPIPNEILSTIFNHVPSSTLTDIACVCQRFNLVAERILYASISIRDVLSNSSPYPWRTGRCCESILRRPGLREAIRKLHIRWSNDSRSPPSHLDLAPTSQTLAQVLVTTVFLESLELWLGPANFQIPPGGIHAVERVVRGCYFPHLLQCSLGAESHKGSPTYSRILETFLASLPSLRHLRLLDHHTALNIPPDALSQLSSFRGSADTSAYLLPGRPVEYLSLVGQDSDVNRDNLPRFTHTSIPLRYLDLSTMSVRPILLRNIATYLPTVEFLRIRLALRHTLHYALSGIRLLAGLASVLGAFPNLTQLDLSPTSVAGVLQSDYDQEIGLCREWSRACPSLRKVTFPSHTEWVLGSDGVWVPGV